MFEYLMPLIFFETVPYSMQFEVCRNAVLTQILAAVAEKASISKKESEVVINAALDTIIDSLKNDEKVQLVGFGSFETKHRAERTGRNPKTKESITIAASKVPTFKAGKAFKDAVAE